MGDLQRRQESGRDTFSMEFDASRALVRATMWGVMDAAEVAEFPRREQQAVIDMGLQSGGFLLLVNTEGTVIQSQKVVSAFTDIATHSPLKAKSIAVVRGSLLTRMQTQRILMIRDKRRSSPACRKRNNGCSRQPTRLPSDRRGWGCVTIRIVKHEAIG